MDVVHGEWIVKRRNCAATLNNSERENQNHINSTLHNKNHQTMSIN